MLLYYNLYSLLYTVLLKTFKYHKLTKCNLDVAQLLA